MHSAVTRTVFAKVAQSVAQIAHIDPSKLSQSMRLEEDLGLSQLGRLKLLVCLEQAFDTEFQDDAIAGFNSLGDIVSHLSHRYFRDVEPFAMSTIAESTASEAAVNTRVPMSSRMSAADMLEYHPT